MSYRSTVFGRVPHAYYFLDELAGATFVDAVAAQNAALTGAATYGLAGARGDTGTAISLGDPVGHTRVFTGYLTLPSAAFDPGSGDFAIECFLRPDFAQDTFTAYQLFTSFDGANRLRFIPYNNDSRMAFFSPMGNVNGASVPTPPLVNPFVYQHLVWSWASGPKNLMMYLDGVGYGPWNLPGATFGTTSAGGSNLLGAFTPAGGAACPATIDEFATYHHTLDGSDFSAAAAGGGWGLGVRL